MALRVDAHQPSYALPPLPDVADGDADKPDDASIVTTRFGPAEVPALVFGAASFSAHYNTDDRFIQGVMPLRIVRLALRYGIRAFDTAPYYGPSETVLGIALSALHREYPRSSYQIFTKCGRYGDTRDMFDYTPNGVRSSIARSLARLRTAYLDTVYLHDVEFIATSVAPRTSGDHRAALGAEAEAYGLAPGQEAIVHGDGDRAVLDAVGELWRLHEDAAVRRVGISGYPLPTLLRLAILVKHTPPYKPLDVVMSYCHLTLQNSTLLEFRAAFEQRAGVKHFLTASPLGMGLLTTEPPAWHPASEEIKEAVKKAIGMSRKSDSESGLPELALEYAFQKAKELGIPTVVGLGSLRDVHESARAWHSVDKQGLGENEEWRRRVQDVRTLFGDGLLDRSWENPGFRE